MDEDRKKAEQDISHSPIYKTLELRKDLFCSRILTILPGANDDPIRCRLKVVAINAYSRYEALSYTWGEETEQQTISVNNAPFVVRENLYNALKQLRRRHKSRRIWADAISINQADLEERALQVKEMGHIYRNAERVLIWLGPDTDVIAEAAHHDKARNHRPGYEREEQLSYKVFRDLAGHSWFYRVWVVQELSMASRDPLMLCGNFTLPWSRLVKNAHDFRKYGLQILEMNDMRARAQRPPQLRNATNSTQGIAGLLEDDLLWFRCTAMFKASDPRDRLYALLGLTRGPLGKSIEIDYTISATSLIKRVMISQVEKHRNLDLLTLCYGTFPHSPHSQEPTWVPSLDTNGLHCLPVIATERLDPTPKRPSSDPFYFDLAKFRGTVSAPSVNGSQICSILHSGQTLQARGCCIGTVTEVIYGLREESRIAKTVRKGRVWDSSDTIVPEGNSPETRRKVTDSNDYRKISLQSLELTGVAYQYLDRHFTAKQLQIMTKGLSGLEGFSLLPNRTRWTEIDLPYLLEQWELLESHKQALEKENRSPVSLGPDYRNDATQLLPLIQRLQNFLSHAVASSLLDYQWRPLTSNLRSALSSSNIPEPPPRTAAIEWEAADWHGEDSKRLNCDFPALNDPALHGRHQFITDTGLIGLGPSSILKGDTIVVLRASSFAYALRNAEEEGCQRLVGQVFVCPPQPVDKTEYWRETRPTTYPENWKSLVEEEFVVR